MVNFGPLEAKIGLPLWGTPANFNRFSSWLRYCTEVAQRTSTKLCTLFGRLLGWYIIIYILGALAPDGILPAGKFTLHPGLAFSFFWQRYTARHSRAIGVSRTLRRGNRKGITKLSLLVCAICMASGMKIYSQLLISTIASKC